MHARGEGERERQRKRVEGESVFVRTGGRKGRQRAGSKDCSFRVSVPDKNRQIWRFLYIFFFFLSNMDSLVRVIRRDVASAIKELLNTVNTVLRKYQHQNRRVSGYISKFKKKKKCLCAQTQLLWNKWSWKAVCIYWLGSGTAEERVCEILQELQWHSQNLLQRWKVRHCF